MAHSPRLRDRRRARPDPHLRLRANGLLEYVRWHPARRRIEATPVGVPTREQLYQLPCVLDPDVTFGDIMLLLAREARFWHRLMGRWTEQFIGEATMPRLVGPEDNQRGGRRLAEAALADRLPASRLLEPFNESLFDDNLLRLELRWYPVRVAPEDYQAGRVAVPDEMEFDGVGRFNRISVVLSPVHQMNPYVVKVFSSYDIHDDTVSEWEEDRLLGTREHQPSLYAIVHGIVHEVSFCGPPARRDHVRDVAMSATDEEAADDQATD